MPPPPHIRTPKPQAEKPPSPRRPVRVGGALAILAVLSLVVAVLNLPEHLDPFAPLDPTRAPNAVTPWQLTRSTASTQACFSAVARAPDIALARLADREDSAECHIRGRVSLRRLGTASLRPVETRCDIALRLYMWQRHVVEPAALRHFGVPVTEVLHYDSYSCRQMRTTSGISSRMSLHATAGAVDIAGFRLQDGRQISLRDTWSDADTAAFWHEVRDGACTWFRTVLSPDYNALHADHFHLAQGRWPSCR